MMGDSAHVLRGAVIEETPHPLACTDPPELLAQPDIVREILFQLVPLRVPVGTIDWPLRDRVGLRLVHQIGNPGRNRLNQNLRAFTLEEIEHVEVAVTLGELCPEYAGDHMQRVYEDSISFA